MNDDSLFFVTWFLEQDINDDSLCKNTSTKDCEISKKNLIIFYDFI